MPDVLPFASEAFDNRIDVGSRRVLHRHGGHELNLVRDPGVTLFQRGIAVPAVPGTLVLHRSVEEHGVASDRALARMLVINYEPDPQFEAELPALADEAPRRWHLGDAQMAAFLDLFTRLQLELDGRRPGRNQAASAWLRLILVFIARLDAPQTEVRPQAFPTVDEDVHRLRRAIDLRRQGSVSGALHELVDNYDALRHRFRRVYGESPVHMLARLRVEKARSLLTTTELSMADIARDCGYARQHEFSRAFHREVGCTPTAFRRQARRG
jgi:AraC-like DNA-binding protein